MKKIFTLICVFIILNMSCKGQSPVYGEHPVELEDFNFSMNVNEFYPEKYKLTGDIWEDDEKHQFYRIPVNSDTVHIHKETLENHFSELDPKPQWNQYQANGWSSRDKLASFGEYPFNTISLITTMDDKIMLVNGHINRITEEKSDEFIRFLTSKYGQYNQKKETVWGWNPLIAYTWVLNDRIIQYCSVFDDERGTISLYVDKENGVIESREKRPHFSGYLYIINKEYESTIMHRGMTMSGHFVYFNSSHN